MFLRVRFLLVGLLALLSTSCVPWQQEPIPDLYALPDFKLLERSGKQVGSADLQGHVWIASFIFTRCGGPCPRVTATMRGLQNELRDHPDIRLVTFTVDPEHDTSAVLSRYADKYEADPNRWWFLTGDQKEMYPLFVSGFKLATYQNAGENRREGQEVVHSSRLVLVDKEGHIRGYYEGDQPGPNADPVEKAAAANKLRQLREQALRLQDGPIPFPAVNAGLNATCVVLLVVGWVAIRRRLIGLHKVCMLSALAVSAIFLSSYLFFHLVIRHGQATRFEDRAPGAPEWVKMLYYAILISHTLLAVVVAPLALTTATFGLRNSLGRHRWLGRWTMPLWLYVSVTGVVVYVMLYRLY